MVLGTLSVLIREFPKNKGLTGFTNNTLYYLISTTSRMTQQPIQETESRKSLNPVIKVQTFAASNLMIHKNVY